MKEINPANHRFQEEEISSANAEYRLFEWIANDEIELPIEDSIVMKST
jgi:hypothetical protein